MLQRIISGGQTGVDRAALDAALELGLPCGGYCPAGRRAEDGTIPLRYPLEETPSPSYAARTWANVRLADATLVLSPVPPRGGTALTIFACQRLSKAYLVVDPRQPQAIPAVLAWLAEHRVGVLNVAGPRESQCPGVYARARAFLLELFSKAARRSSEASS